MVLASFCDETIADSRALSFLNTLVNHICSWIRSPPERDTHLVACGAQVSSCVAHEELNRWEIREHRDPLVTAALAPAEQVEHRGAAWFHEHLNGVAVKEDLVSGGHGDRRRQRMSAPREHSPRVLTEPNELLGERRLRVSL